jgi:HSP20 family protein
LSVDLVPWSPWNELRPSRILDRLFEEPWRMLQGWAAGPAMPAIEVFERGNDVVVRAEVAGVQPRDLEVRLADDTVTIRGERRSDVQREQDGYFHSERQYGAFVRTVALPATVDAGRARAHFRNGLLEIVAPRRDEGARRGRKLDIEVQ